eukprot:Tamp_19757.p1 GENE.Tamp_19757~~Tamp_19757.p1  ORF type:complete len:256 (+),score=44.14 Tamp_19757:117-770(+)
MAGAMREAEADACGRGAAATATTATTPASSGKRFYPAGFNSPLVHRHESFVGSDPPVRAAEVADHVFDEIAAAGELRPAALGRLLALYKANTLESALSLVDKKMVQKLVVASGRSLYLVESSSDEPYVCFKQYCPCPYYQHSVINRPEALACKHILAARIADAVGKIEVLDASIEDFVEWTLKQEQAAMSTSRSPNKSFTGRTPRRTPKTPRTAGST